MTMRLQHFFACAASLWLSQVTGQSIVWSDEFDSQSTTPNPNYWSNELGNNNGWGNGELQEYTDFSATLASGMLWITVERDPTTGAFTSARISTQDKVLIQYGTIEARISVPDVIAGLWPAFWTLGADLATVGWPAAGEYNIMEMGQGLGIAEGVGNKRVVSAAHWEYNNTYATYAGHYDSPVDLNGTFHLYKMDWTPSMVTTYVDDAIIWQMNIDPIACIDCSELHEPQFLVLNVAVGGGFTSGNTSSSSSGSSSAGCGGSSGSSSGSCGSLRTPEDITAPLPAVMMVDYVRVYDNGYTNVTLPNSTETNTTNTTASPIPVPTTVAPVPAPVGGGSTPAPVTGAPVAANITTAPVAAPVTAAPVSSPISAPVPVTAAPVPVTAAPVTIPISAPVPVPLPVALPVAPPTTAAPTKVQAVVSDAPSGVEGVSTPAPSINGDGIFRPSPIFNRPNRPSAPSPTTGKGGKGGKKGCKKSKKGKGEGKGDSSSSGKGEGKGDSSGKGEGKGDSSSSGKGEGSRRLDEGKGGKGEDESGKGGKGADEDECDDASLNALTGQSNTISLQSNTSGATMLQSWTAWSVVLMLLAVL